MDKQITINLSSEDKILIEKVAKENSLPTSSYARFIILNRIRQFRETPFERNIEQQNREQYQLKESLGVSGY